MSDEISREVSADDKWLRITRVIVDTYPRCKWNNIECEYMIYVRFCNCYQLYDEDGYCQGEIDEREASESKFKFFGYHGSHCKHCSDIHYMYVMKDACDTKGTFLPIPSYFLGGACVTGERHNHGVFIYDDIKREYDEGEQRDDGGVCHSEYPHYKYSRMVNEFGNHELDLLCPMGMPGYGDAIDFQSHVRLDLRDIVLEGGKKSWVTVKSNGIPHYYFDTCHSKELD